MPKLPSDFGASPWQEASFASGPTRITQALSTNKLIMTHLANHSLDREILYSTLGGLQPGGMCLAWVSGATICEALRLMQRFDPKTTWDKRVFVYFSFFMSVSLLSLFQARIYQDVIVHYGDYQKLLEVTDILSAIILMRVNRSSMPISRRSQEVRAYLVSPSIPQAHECLGETSGFLYYSYDVWQSGLGKLRMWKIPIIKVSTCVLYLLTTAAFISRITTSFLQRSVAHAQAKKNWPPYRVVGSIQVQDVAYTEHRRVFTNKSLIFIIYVLPWKLIEGAVLSLMKAYDLVKSGEAQKVLADTDDPSVFIPCVKIAKLGLCWSVLCCLCQTAILPTVFDLIALSLPTSLGVNGAAHSMRSISAQLHLFGPSVAISAALDDMTFPSVELCCSPKNSVSEEMYETSKNILTFRKEKKIIQASRNGAKGKFDLISNNFERVKDQRQ
ncbi:hypothetical protein MJO28_003805 [Puccinia striiformis f. sp. tritici]|uniref:Uncharacterized protein n=1 Tax=Puccinia striiformis f. sp. tritici TaxID=168172 RepID=A0ACC0ENN0_9BASI|nr:hypothetical protein MJO28_003805 [Puccinia striiformis f. sp. tritici]